MHPQRNPAKIVAKNAAGTPPGHIRTDITD
jgi:hypothetical protein